MKKSLLYRSARPESGRRAEIFARELLARSPSINARRIYSGKNLFLTPGCLTLFVKNGSDEKRRLQQQKNRIPEGTNGKSGVGLN
jgi:hypothetical protein